MRFFLVLNFLLLVVVTMVAVEAAIPLRPRAPFVPKAHNIVQACRGIMEDECGPQTPERMDCLTTNFNSISDHECKMWLSSRVLCFSFVEIELLPAGKCGDTTGEDKKTAIRRCLRDVSRKLLPSLCTDSAYYKSIFLHQRKLSEDGDL